MKFGMGFASTDHPAYGQTFYLSALCKGTHKAGILKFGTCSQIAPVYAPESMTGSPVDDLVQVASHNFGDLSWCVAACFSSFQCNDEKPVPGNELQIS